MLNNKVGKGTPVLSILQPLLLILCMNVALLYCEAQTQYKMSELGIVVQEMAREREIEERERKLGALMAEKGSLAKKKTSKVHHHSLLGL